MGKRIGEAGECPTRWLKRGAGVRRQRAPAPLQDDAGVVTSEMKGTEMGFVDRQEWVELGGLMREFEDREENSYVAASSQLVDDVLRDRSDRVPSGRGERV